MFPLTNDISLAIQLTGLSKIGSSAFPSSAEKPGGSGQDYVVASSRIINVAFLCAARSVAPDKSCPYWVYTVKKSDLWLLKRSFLPTVYLSLNPTVESIQKKR